MEKDWSARDFQEELTKLPHLDALMQLVCQVTHRLLEARNRDMAAVAAPLLKEVTFNRLDHQTTLGDTIAVLERGPQGRRDQLLLGALLARSLQLAPPTGTEAEHKTACDLLWLAAHAGVDAFPSLEATLGAKASGIWASLCDLLQRIDRGREDTFDRADATIGALILRDYAPEEVRQTAARLTLGFEDPLLAGLLRGGSASTGISFHEGDLRLTGELQPTPRGPLLTTITALTGWMLVEAVLRILSRAALQRRSPAELEITPGGLRLRARTEMLGRVLREVEHVVPLDGLAVASREVRFPHLVLYAGLLALMLGSYLGASLLGDGIKAASPSLLGQGLLLLAAGIALELGAATLFPGARGRCRVILIPKKGRPLCLGDVDVENAQRTLARLSHRT
ncbi:MAG: hypothetical protein RMJ98_11580 [Myxococcales bacterium]|nr:hypothetical protein [Polyangiaceae bacterium]MDW8249928.1 hypothetical protein [Myxococcales bacterium]